MYSLRSTVTLILGSKKTVHSPSIFDLTDENQMMRVSDASPGSQL